MAIYLLGISSRPGRVEFDSLGDIQFKGSHYYLYLRWGHSGDPDGLTLYECNSLALLCEDVHFSHDYYWGDAVELVTDDTTKTVQIVVNGNVLYTHATVAHGE